MKGYKHYGSKTATGSRWWYFQRFSGLVLFVMVLLHFAIMHFIPEAGMRVSDASGKAFATFESVRLRFANPMWKAFDITFLVLAVGHAYNGMWQVFMDWKVSDASKALIKGVLAALWLGLLAVGVTTLVTFKG